MLYMLYILYILYGTGEKETRNINVVGKKIKCSV